MTPLTGQIVLITGASGGLGRALALALAPLGARLALNARRADALDAVVAEVAALGGEARAFPGDVADGSVPPALVGAVEAALGPVDVLVNNAGRADQGLTELLDDATLEAMLDLNLRAPLRLCQAVLPGMRARGRGHVVNVVSHAALHGFGATPAYAMAKAALHALTLNLSYELVGTGVDVTGIYPGLVDTGFAQAMTPEGGTTAELMTWMRNFRAGLRASPTFKAIERAQQAPEVAQVIVSALLSPGQLMVFTQPVHQAAAADMIAQPKEWARESQAFYGAFLAPMREMLVRFTRLAREARSKAKGDEGG